MWIAECCKCKGMGGTLFSLYAPGMAYMCIDCIEDEEKQTDTVALFSLKGVGFFTQEQYEEMKKSGDAE